MDRPHGQPVPSGTARVFGSELADLRARLDRSRVEGRGNADAEMLLADLETAYDELRVADEEVHHQQEQIAELLEGQTLMRYQQERMMAALPVVSIVTDPDGTIRLANAATLRLLGHRSSRLLGTPITRLFSAEEQSPLRQMLTTLAGGEASVQRRTTLMVRDGERLEVSVTASRSHGSAPELTWIVLEAGVDHLGDEGATSTLPTALARMARLVSETDDLQWVLQRAAELVAEGLGEGFEVTVTLGSPEAPDVLASTGVSAQILDGAQIAHGEGPSVTAFVIRETVRTDDLRRDPRWPRLSTDVPLAIGGVVAVPLHDGDRLIGALNAYRTHTEPADGLVARVELLADTIASVVRGFGMKSELRRLAADMERALGSRAVIDLAKGIVIAEHGCTPDEAFQHLVRLSSTQQLKLRDVARSLVERRGGSSLP